MEKLTDHQIEIEEKKGVGKYRYRILALLFMATTINYMDRSIMGVLGPTLIDKVFFWSDMDYAYINMGFKIAYAIGMVSMGAIIDRLGTKIGYTVAIAIWSVSGMLHAAVRPAFSMLGFTLARVGLGLGESGNFPACIKTVAEWFPKRERAWATGLFNAGANVGAVMAPLVIPFIVAENGDGWQFAFLITGAFSLLWIVLWNKVYRKPEEHPSLSKEELAYIQSDQDMTAEKEAEESKLAWKDLLPLKETWAVAFGKFMTDPVWWFFLFWGGKFLADRFGLELKGLALPMIIIFGVADLGSIAGGWLSSSLIQKGYSVNAGRKITMLICGLCVLPVAMAPHVESQWTAVALIALAAAAHQAWSANIFTVASDVFPKKATASIVGIAGMAGAVGGFLADWGVGHVLESARDAAGNLPQDAYTIPFVVAAFGYLIALGVIQLFIPKLETLKKL
ncbi:MFS transporter [Limibacter armeniacum]|uniref:MFS transporter n=1 Tax=Limibacter armeniacum TaxID=466084 RepID=UPI002FE5E6E9